MGQETAPKHGFSKISGIVFEPRLRVAFRPPPSAPSSLPPPPDGEEEDREPAGEEADRGPEGRRPRARRREDEDRRMKEDRKGGKREGWGSETDCVRPPYLAGKGPLRRRFAPPRPPVLRPGGTGLWRVFARCFVSPPPAGKRTTSVSTDCPLPTTDNRQLNAEYRNPTTVRRPGQEPSK